MLTVPAKRPREALEASDLEHDSNSGGSEPVSAPDPVLTLADVNNLSSKIVKHCDTLSSWLSNEKDTKRKTELHVAIKAIYDSYISLSNAYTYTLASNNTAKSLKNSLDNACEHVSRTCTALSDRVASTAEHSYASIVSRSSGQHANLINAQGKEPATRVSLARGKPFSISSTERVVIGPTEHAKERFPTANATKVALHNCIDPVRLKMRVKRVSHGSNSSIIIDAEALNAEALSSSAELAAAGLEVKPDVKLNPRLAIHDIPVDLSDDEIINCVVEQNLPGVSAADFKLIYVYPKLNKKTRSCIVETLPQHRTRPLRFSKININWSVCRIDDHVSILQCFNCFGFGHIASACKDKASCGSCAGENLSKNCSGGNDLKCINCVKAKLGNTAHSARDQAKCPILRRKID